MSEVVLRIPCEAGISEIGSVAAKVEAALRNVKAGSSVVIDLSGTRRADSSLAQLMIAIKAESVARGFNLSVKSGDSELSLLSMLECDLTDALCQGTAADASAGGDR